MPTLDWIGKQAVVNHHRKVPYRLLHCDKTLSVGDPDSGNLLVQGDNLEALQALRPYYAGKVKCIYIDPPYNTGNEGWIYNDNVNSPEIRRWLGEVVGKEAEDLTRHDKWLCMIYPRLALLRDFLTEDGAIFVSIDDNELPRLQLLMQEIYGAANQVATLVWEKGKKGDAKLVSVTHEYVVVYAKNKTHLVSNGIRWRRRKPGVEEVLAHYASLRTRFGTDHSAIRREIMAWYRGLPAGDPRKSHKHYNWSDDRGLYFPDNFHGPDDGRESRPRYDIFHPVTGRACAKPSTGWRWEEPRTLAALADTPPRIHFGADETTIPCRKSYLIEVDQEPYQSVFYTDGRAATLQLERLVGRNAFAFPKDHKIIGDLIALPDTANCLVLDSFAGSGTTGHAVLTQNKADGGSRAFILIEMDAAIARDVTSPRLRRVIEGDGAGAGLGGGFRFCTLGSAIFDDSGMVAEAVRFADLAAHVYFVETGTPLPNRANGTTPLFGVHQGRAFYLLYNGVLGDKRPASGNVLTHAVAEALPPHPDGAGPRIVFGEACRLGDKALASYGIIFRQIPFDLKIG
jgi:hypothetical protein